jgi:hypothetical protein
MLSLNKLQFVVSLLAFAILVCANGPTAAAVRIEGLVQGGGGPLANSTVTLWAASAGQPRQLAQARTNSDGRFEVGSQETLGSRSHPARKHFGSWHRGNLPPVARGEDGFGLPAMRCPADACNKLFAAATPPTDTAPTDTLTAAQSIARYPWYQPERLFALLDEFELVQRWAQSSPTIEATAAASRYWPRSAVPNRA